jgi:hypothetical protein
MDGRITGYAATVFDSPEGIVARPVCQLSLPLGNATITHRRGVFFPAFTDDNSILC